MFVDGIDIGELGNHNIGIKRRGIRHDQLYRRAKHDKPCPDCDYQRRGAGI
jgi:hypothetical protein